MIPTCNPKDSYLSHKDEIDAAIISMLNNGHYVLGDEVEKFEKEYADWNNIGYAVSVANGTDAIELALRASGVRLDDHVITVSHTAVATVSAIRRCGAIPLFADIDDDYLLSTKSLKKLLENNTYKNIKAIVVVHLYGMMADMPEIIKFAKKYNLKIIEDCAQAHGSKFNGIKAGTWGDYGCFSFYPTKNLGAIGDGGIVITNRATDADRLRELRQYGWRERYISYIEGINSRLDELQAAILRIKLKYLDRDNEARRNIAKIYTDILLGVEGIKLPCLYQEREHVYHQYVIQTEYQQEIIKTLRDRKIFLGIHYPLPVHMQPAYQLAAYMPVELTKTEYICNRITSLPMFPDLKEEQVVKVANEIRNFLIKKI